MEVVLALLAGWLLGLCSSQLVGRWSARALWLLLRRLDRPRRLWRVSRKTWTEEEAVGLAWLPVGCENCEYWDNLQGNEGASRLHAAADHVGRTGDGQRWVDGESVEVPDRHCSLTSSAAVAIFRSYSGAWLHRVDVAAEADVLDLRWLCEVPYLEQQCSECRRCGSGEHRLAVDAAQYMVHWGVHLQEALLDRCSRGHIVRSVELQDDGLPLWSKELARKVVLQCYRRREKGRHVAEASWLDLWALVQEWRLRRVLDRL